MFWGYRVHLIRQHFSKQLYTGPQLLPQGRKKIEFFGQAVLLFETFRFEAEDDYEYEILFKVFSRILKI